MKILASAILLWLALCGGVHAQPQCPLTPAVGTDNSLCASTAFVKRSLAAVSLSLVTNSLGADVALNNVANFFDGPSVAQGTIGTWFASGTVSLAVSPSDQIYVKLWDGTTVISSTATRLGSGTGQVSISVSGFVAAPAGNIRISVKNLTTTTGAISFNTSGNSKDSTISAIRVQ